MRDSSVELDLIHFQESISSLFDFLKGSSASGILLQKLDAFDNYLMSHSVNMCYLSLLLGMKLERYLIDQRRFKSAKDAKDLQYLGLGCLLHDVGKMRIPTRILNKPGSLTEDEFSEMRRHTVYGYEMVKGTIPASASQVVLNHHQRWDGTGYPDRIDRPNGNPAAPPRGTQIPIFPRIAVVADVYDAATTERCYSAAKLPVQALHEMRTVCRGFFDPVVEEAFYQIVPPFPIGQVVTLSDGVEAVVVDFNPAYPTRPKVQCLRAPDGTRYEYPPLEEIDLAGFSDLKIASVDGQDVRPYTAAWKASERVEALA
jgi:HD-GYP domain-containing protein (c-di-GMP phosphodiesterase class II)